MSKNSFLQILLAVLFISIFAQLKIDLPLNAFQIPITGQSFAVLVAAFFLGPRKAGLAILLYLLLGLSGLPVFAKGASGIEVFQKGTGGYLYGFLFAGIIVGWLGQKGWRSHFFKTLLAMFIGTAIILIGGLSQLSYLYGWEKALEYGFYPFIGGALVKVLLGAIVVYGIRRNGKI